MYQITAKLGNMRKATTWTIYPQSKPGYIEIQSDHRIALIHALTKRASLSKHCKNGAYFVHLNKSAGATKISIDTKLMEEIKAILKSIIY